MSGPPALGFRLVGHQRRCTLQRTWGTHTPRIPPPFPIAGQSLWRSAVTPTYLLPCSCGREIPVSTTQAGEEVTCECGTRLEAPTMRGMTLLKRSDPQSIRGGLKRSQSGEKGRTRGSAAKTPTSSWGGRQRVLLVGTVITIVGLALAIFFHVTRPRLAPIESLAPYTTWQLWHDLRTGVDRRPQWEEYYLEGVAIRQRWVVVASTIGGIGVLIMACSMLVPSRPSQRRRSRLGPKPRGPTGKPSG